MTQELTETEFKNTFGDRMTDITQVEIDDPINIWDYVGELAKAKLVQQRILDQQLVKYVYRNNQETYDHVLLPTDHNNVFMVIVVDLQERSIFGHITLDLNKEYGIE